MNITTAINHLQKIKKWSFQIFWNEQNIVQKNWDDKKTAITDNSNESEYTDREIESMIFIQFESMRKKNHYDAH